MAIGGELAGRVSEDLVYTCLESSRREGDVVWRNQRLTTDARNAEVDFLLGLPGSGFVALEVKGGTVTVEGDAWIQQSRSGYRKRINPMTQAREGMYGLRDYVEADPRWGRRGHARWAHAVVLPFSTVAADFALPDCPRHMIFGQDDLEDLVPKLAEIADRQQRDRSATADDVMLVGEILLGRGHPQAALLGEAAEREDLAEYLTPQQRTILDLTPQLSRIEVRGGPGSGKTFLALEQTRQLSQDGKRVALLCYSRGLAAFLARATAHWLPLHRPAYVGTFDGLASQPATERFDAIVVDEAQDFADNWWPRVLRSLRDPAAGQLTLMSDEGHSGSARAGAIPDSQAVLVLGHNLRNTRQIVESFQPLAPTVVRSLGGEGPPTLFVDCKADDAVAAADDVVRQFLALGRPPEDIAVLTTKDRHPIQKLKQDESQTAYWDSFWDDRELFYGHALGFKGLERPVVVLAVNESQIRDGAHERLYVGMSRAREELVVCGDAAYLTSVGGPRLAQELRAGAVAPDLGLLIDRRVKDD